MTYHPPASPPHRRPRGRPRRPWYRTPWILAAVSGAAALAVTGGVFGAVTGTAGRHGPASLTPIAATTTAVPGPFSPRPTPPAPPGPAKARTVAVFTGSGQEKTPVFTVTSTWRLAYSFSCSPSGQAGTFTVTEDGGGLSEISVRQHAIRKTGSTWSYGNAGKHYLRIASTCDWKVTVSDEP